MRAHPAPSAAIKLRLPTGMRKNMIVELYTGNLRERNMLNHILSEGLGGPTIDAAKQEHIYGVEKKSQMTIWETRENR